MQTDILFDKRRSEYLTKTRSLFSAYMHKQKKLKTNDFLSLCSWPKPSPQKDGYFSFEDHEALFCAKNRAIQEGGYFLSLNGQGICINPNKDFFRKLCEKGYTLKDIDIIIATTADATTKEAIMQLHALNREFSRTLISYGQEPHIIRFFLHPELMSPLASLFRPIFRQELSSVISLETFARQAEVRALDDTLTLSYTKTEAEGLACRIDSTDHSFGFVSQGGYHDALGTFFAPCSVIAAGIGSLSAEDLEKVSLQVDSLGYFGISKLIEACPNLKLLLVSEFCRSMGDVRLETVQKLTSEYPEGPKILALDENFSLDLDAFAVNTYGNTYCSYDECRVIRLQGAFGPLSFLPQEDVF